MKKALATATAGIEDVPRISKEHDVKHEDGGHGWCASRPTASLVILVGQCRVLVFRWMRRFSRRTFCSFPCSRPVHWLLAYSRFRKKKTSFRYYPKKKTDHALETHRLRIRPEARAALAERAAPDLHRLNLLILW